MDGNRTGNKVKGAVNTLISQIFVANCTKLVRAKFVSSYLFLKVIEKSGWPVIPEAGNRGVAAVQALLTFPGAFPIAGTEEGTAAISLYYKRIPSQRRSTLLSGFTGFWACFLQSVTHRAALTATEFSLSKVRVDTEQMISEKWC